MDSRVAVSRRTRTATAGQLKSMLYMLLVVCTASMAALPVAAEVVCTVYSGVMGEPAWYVDCSTEDDTDGNETQTGHSSPTTILFVAQRPGNAHEIGVKFDSGAGTWAIFNQDLAAMPIGIAFNVHSTPAGPAVFVQHVTPTNTTGSGTLINHPLTNGKPNVLLQVTQNWNPGGSGGTYNSHTIGVRYNVPAGQWVIFNQDGTPMPIGADFNVKVTNAGGAASLHRATGANTAGATTYIDLPPLNGNPNAIILVTQNWNPDGVGGIGNPHTIALRYDNARDRWAIFNQDGAPMPIGVAFNLHFVLSGT